MNISIKQIKAFLALVEEDNFTRAAQKVHLSQPAFSALISNLEQEMGYRLFDRDTRKVQLNENGIHFIKLARDLLTSYDRTISAIKTHSTDRQIKFTLAAIPSIVVQWLSQLLSNFHHNYPKIAIELLDLQGDLCLQMLLAGHAELALTTSTPAMTELSSEFLFSDKFYLVCHREHPLANKDVVELSDLICYDMIGFTQGTSIRLHADRLVDLFKIQYILEVSQLTTMMGLIATNYGISLVPALALSQFQHHDIRIKSIQDITLERSIHLIKHKERKLSPQAETFYQYIKNNIFKE
ncbi:LysR family transcriptional regulator [Orbaceae bacterium ESL0727]|nr:LysR family transcriptional regulator [Orbaceae bacterium ESL0727]